MMNNDRIIDMIEDFALVKDFLNNLVCAVKHDDVDVPNFIPELNDGAVGEQLECLAKAVSERKGGAS